jgi:hypothetical protein
LLATCIRWFQAINFVNVIWGGQCGKSAYWALLGKMSSRSIAYPVIVLARKRQTISTFRKGLLLQRSSNHPASFRCTQLDNPMQSGRAAREPPAILNCDCEAALKCCAGDPGDVRRDHNIVEREERIDRACWLLGENVETGGG